MIDALMERLIRPSEAVTMYPVGPGDKFPHPSRVYRDMKYGRNGIVLESLRTPTLATSRQAVARFFVKLTEARATSSEASGHRRPNARPRANQLVERELDRLGI
jgi:hypothetical protein